MSRLLVTGGTGFIGANFVHHWLKTHPEARLVVLDALTYAGNLDNINDARRDASLRVVHCDIRNCARLEELLREERNDTIVHFAAESHVDRSIHGLDAFVLTNILGTHALLKAARTVWLREKLIDAHRFHHVSTDEVYDSLGPNHPGFHEHSRYAPSSPYSATKAAADRRAGGGSDAP